jgi:hypothetical protein
MAPKNLDKKTLEIQKAVWALNDTIKSLQLQRDSLMTLLPAVPKAKGDFIFIDPRTGKPA